MAPSRFKTSARYRYSTPFVGAWLGSAPAGTDISCSAPQRHIVMASGIQWQWRPLTQSLTWKMPPAAMAMVHGIILNWLGVETPNCFGGQHRWSVRAISLSAPYLCRARHIFVERAISFVERAISFVERAISFVERAISCVERAISFERAKLPVSSIWL